MSNFIIVIAGLFSFFFFAATPIAIGQAASGSLETNVLMKSPDLKTTVAVIPFSASFEVDDTKANYSLMVAERVQTAVEQSKRFIMVDRIDLKKVLGIQKEQDDNEQDHRFWRSVSESHLVEAGRILGVEYILTGNILNVATPILISGGYGCEISFTMKVISVETGRIFATEAVNAKTGSIKIVGSNSKAEAINLAFDKSAEPIKAFLDKYFPTQVLFKEVLERNRKEAISSISLRGGLSDGLRMKQRLDLVTVVQSELGDPVDLMKVRSAESFRKIGEVQLVEIFTEYANCKVIDGSAELEAALSDSSRLIIAQSRGY